MCLMLFVWLDILSLSIIPVEIPAESEDFKAKFLTDVLAAWIFPDSMPRCYVTSMCLCVLTIGTGSLQVRHDSENVVHQVGSLFVLQYAARGGVGWVYVCQIRQVHPWNNAVGRKTWNVFHQTRETHQLSSLMLWAIHELRASEWAKWGQSPSVGGVILNTRVKLEYFLAGSLDNKHI